MYLDIRAGNEGMVDMPFMRLAPGDEYMFFDQGNDPESEEGRRVIHVDCARDEPYGTMLIVPGTPDVMARLADGESLAAVAKESEVRVINGEPEIFTVNNPDRGLKSAKVILRFVAD